MAPLVGVSGAPFLVIGIGALVDILVDGHVDALVDRELRVERIVALAAVRAAFNAVVEGLSGTVKHHLVDFDGLEDSYAGIDVVDLDSRGRHAGLKRGDACID